MNATRSPVYLDYSASTPLKPGVRDAMLAVMDKTGNGSSVHSFGRAQRHIMDEARSFMAARQGVKPENIIFTSGATESNNMALRGFAGRPLLVSAIEHPSVLAEASTRHIKVTREGLIDLNHLEEFLKAADQPVLVSLMLVNNETGVIQPVAEAAALVKQWGGLIHCDAVQAFGRIPVRFADLCVDSLSVSAHKIGGPQGVGALIIRDGQPITPLLTGGGQEMRRRAGTENVAGIAGFAAAINALDSDLAKADEWTSWRDDFEKEIVSTAPDAIIFGAMAPRVANISCVAMPGIRNETQLMAFDLAGYAVSSGSACSSGKVQPSHVLKAMGVADDLATSAIRTSFGWASIRQDLTGFASIWRTFYQASREKQAA